jgi:diguanylate cyclase (GGDEF)-like protein
MTIPQPTILVVDDEPVNCRLLEALLRPEGYLTRAASSGQDALASIAELAPDLILLDVMMPGMDGYAVAGALKADPATSNIPIIMVSARDDHDAQLRGLNSGAEDFLTKPVDRTELWLRVRNLLRLKELSDSLRTERAMLEQLVEARTADLHHLAHHDPLTGLPNRTLFYQSLEKSLALGLQRGWAVAVLLVDLDEFKNVNDTLGHGTGDELLRQFSDRLLQCVRIRDTVGRLGGDEFALILLLDDGQRGAAAVATQIQEALRVPFDLNGREVTVTASIGITIHPDDASEPETLIKYADTAMYRAKQEGRDTFRFFTAQMNAEEWARHDLVAALRKAVDNEEFVLHYQPKVDLANGRVTGLEALIRWQRPGHGLVQPDAFIPALEETGLIVRVGSWVIATACHQIGLWLRSAIGPVRVAVNVSGRQFVEGDLMADVAKGLDVNHLDPGLLELELTESSLMANTERTISTLRSVKQRGVLVSIDDFGTGYSSLAYLRRFPIDTLKIDRAFVTNVTTNPDDAAIALTIIRLAHELKHGVIAEGVETAAQLGYLRRHGCNQVQGNFFSGPLPVVEVEHLLRTGIVLPLVDEVRTPLNTLLLVDEQIEHLAALRVLFEVDGYRVLSARSAAEAFELLALHSVQVIVCDPHTTSMHGTGFVDRVKLLHPETLRIVLSDRVDLDSILNAVNDGAVHRYYTKPWDDGTLRGNISDAFRQYWSLHAVRHERHYAHLEVAGTDDTPGADAGRVHDGAAAPAGASSRTNASGSGTTTRQG